MMDSGGDQVIVVRDTQSSMVARSSFGLAGELSTGGIPLAQSTFLHHVPGLPLARPYSPVAAARISSPMPYHVFAPESKESLDENITHINRALNIDNDNDDEAYMEPTPKSVYYSPR
ncbi:hypothetical protein IWW38_003385 [Coemansia aciculifera]|uniref:Uncharacterized protein n=1 Tax=Coemansia aciculifera TaxID=417176 RepID=A0ACC1M1L8_9FUNG|nr:hypothetical protein IWW38_003385 [Coemansia aciculifera]